jgi:hypothetical protein
MLSPEANLRAAVSYIDLIGAVAYGRYSQLWVW